MKLKRLLLIVLALSLFSAATVVANDGFDWLKAKKIKLKVNGETLSASGLIANIDKDNKTMIPVDDIANALQAVVKWDEASQTLNIAKPNAHIYLLTPQGGSSEGMFARVYYDETSVFSILVHLDSVQEAHSLRFDIIDPADNVVYSSEGRTKEPDAGMIWHRTPKNITMKFKRLGKYTVKVYLKPDEKSDYFLISEKAFESIRK